MPHYCRRCFEIVDEQIQWLNNENGWLEIIAGRQVGKTSFLSGKRRGANSWEGNCPENATAWNRNLEYGFTLLTAAVIKTPRCDNNRAPSRAQKGNERNSLGRRCSDAYKDCSIYRIGELSNAGPASRTHRPRIPDRRLRQTFINGVLQVICKPSRSLGDKSRCTELHFH